MLLLDAPAGERAARAELRRQIELLEDRLVQLDRVPGVAPAPARGPRLLDFAALAEVRDALLARVAAATAATREREASEAAAHELLAAMHADPAAYRRARVTLADLGEPGCGVYRVRPLLGVIGRLAGWWELTLSSGCPLA
jgi:cell division protein FtsB